jgi:hypothetical protein
MVIWPSETENNWPSSAAAAGAPHAIHNKAPGRTAVTMRQTDISGNSFSAVLTAAFQASVHELLMTRTSVIKSATLIKPNTTTVVMATARLLC